MTIRDEDTGRGPRDETPEDDAPGRPTDLLRGWGIRIAVVAAVVLLVLIVRPSILRQTLGSPQAIAIVAVLIGLWILVGRLLQRVIPNPLIRNGILALPAVALAWFVIAPFFLGKTVVEELPGLATAGTSSGSTAGAATAPGGDAPAGDAAVDPAAGLTELGRGEIVGIDHRASGGAALYRLADGSAVVRLEDIDISPGPDYDVYLVPEADATSPGAGVKLDDLKGNKGSQNYPVPAEISVDGPQTVLIWCTAFAVPIAAAPLA